MAETTKIQWCHATFNPWVGCTKVNEGCKFCYAEMLMDTRYGRVVWGPNGTRSLTKTWGDPLRWNRQAARDGERRKVFCASLADVFEGFEGPVLTSKSAALWRDRQGRLSDAEASGFDPWEIVTTLDPLRSNLFKLIDRCQSLDFLLLTKRPENVRPMWEGPNRSNCWIGASIANQRNADEWIPRLLSCRGLGPVLFLSVEPQVGRVDLSRYLFPSPVVDWVIVGGESQQGGEPRPFQLDWARLIVQQCREANVPCFVKQLGSNAWDGSVEYRTRDGHGGDWNEWPEELRVRQCPETFYPQLVAV